MRPLRMAVIVVGALASAGLLLSSVVLITISDLAGRVGIAIMSFLGAAFLGLGTWGLFERWFPDGWPR